MRIQKLYDQYKIMPQLQLHMLRVAGVASIILDNFDRKSDRELVLSACLLHDIGNIVKFKLDRFPNGLEPQGLNYWREVKTKFENKYGKSDKKVTLKIINELSVNEKVITILEPMSFLNIDIILDKNSYEQMIVAYSDSRVSPRGIVSMDNRHNEAKKRYVDEIKKIDPGVFQNKLDLWKLLEKKIFDHCTIKPEDITDEKINNIIPKLRGFEIETR